MKKLSQFFLAVFILGTCLLAQAGTSRNIKPSDPAPEFTSTVRAEFIGINDKKRIEIILVVQVLDFNNHPVHGALVSAPCTGQANKLTDVYGIASWNLGNTCTCNSDNVTVTTPGGCYQVIKATCGGTNQAFCNK